jgi:hypothetical protein
LKPIVIDHTEAENVAIVSGMAIPELNSIVHCVSQVANEGIGFRCDGLAVDDVGAFFRPLGFCLYVLLIRSVYAVFVGCSVKLVCVEIKDLLC